MVGQSEEHQPGNELNQLADLMVTLRARCPWDREQTHATLRRHLLEESYEVLEVLDALAASDVTDHGEANLSAISADLAEELGDLLFQVVFHARIAEEAGQFDLVDVIRGVHDKLVGRHQHIFGDAAVPEDLAGDWERAKRREKNRSSVMDGIPQSLPALAFAAKLVAKAQAISPDLVAGAIADPPSPEYDAERALGRELFAIVVRARSQGLDAESALRRVVEHTATQVRNREVSDG